MSTLTSAFLIRTFIVMMSKRGRPPIPDGERLATRLEVRLTTTEKADYREAARAGGFSSISEWARGHLKRAASLELRRSQSQE